MKSAQVIIVGAGPAGLMSALLLARYGIEVVLIERHSGTSVHPKARGLNIRTMEILRSIGLEDAVKDSGRELEKSHFMLFVESLAGREIRRIPDDDLMMKGEALAQYTPCTWVQCSQDKLERTLARVALEAGAELLFEHEFSGLRQDRNGVICRVIDRVSGQEHEIHAQYALACDGANSPVREALGLNLQGRSAMEHFVNIYFRCDLSQYVKDRWFGICFVENAEVKGLFLPVDNERLWLLNLEYDPAQTSANSFTEARCKDLVRSAIGNDQSEPELLSVLPWVASARVVPTFRKERVFLVGDSAHVMPPAGGFGLNTAMQDAHNLAWKLAYVLKNKAATSLLDSYEQERLPLAKEVVAFAEREMDAPNPWEHGDEQESRDHGVEGGPSPWEVSLEDQLKAVIGFQYRSSAINEGKKVNGLEMKAYPGTRFPHVFLKDGRSTLDLLPKGFAIVSPERTRWETGAKVVELPDEVWDLMVPGRDVEAILVRPDGMVATAGQRSKVAGAMDELLQAAPA